MQSILVHLEYAMPNLTFRCNQEFIDSVKSTAEKKQMSMSDFVRTAVLHFIGDASHPQSNASTETIYVLQTQVDTLHKQLETKDEQILQLHQLVAMSLRHSSDLVNQLEQTTKQLESQRQNGKWWRFFKRFRMPSSG